MPMKKNLMQLSNGGSKAFVVPKDWVDWVDECIKAKTGKKPANIKDYPAFDMTVTDDELIYKLPPEYRVVKTNQ